MKIGIDCRLWNESGVGRYTRNLVQQLQSIDKTNEYVLFAGNNVISQVQNIVQNDNFKLTRADIRWHSLAEQIRFPPILNKENLDLVHFPYFSVPILYNKPFVVTIHDLIINHFPTGQATTLPLLLYDLKLLGYKYVISKAAKKAKKIITVSNATKKEIIEHLHVPLDKVEVTYEGVEEKVSGGKYQVASKEKNTKYEILNTDYFLYVGNAYPHKNLERLLEAFRRIMNSFGSSSGRVHELGIRNLKLILVGKEDYFYKKLKEKVKKMNLDGSVIFYGEASDQELKNLYQNARALIFPSLMEGFGLPALEAMSQGCLVLCSDIPSLKEVCSDAALYFDPLNAQELSSKMTDVCFNDLNHFNKLKDRGLERSKMFSWQTMAKQTLKVYNSLKE